MDAATSAAIADLRRKVDSLTSQLRGSIGVSSSGGSLNIRTTQLGFAAQLTSAYNATTGYSWKRLFLNTTTPAFTNPTIQPTGNLAFEVTGSTSVAINTKVWMEPSPDASGCVFTNSGGSSEEPWVLGSHSLNDTYAIDITGYAYEPSNSFSVSDTWFNDPALTKSREFSATGYMTGTAQEIYIGLLRLDATTPYGGLLTNFKTLWYPQKVKIAAGSTQGFQYHVVIDSAQELAQSGVGSFPANSALGLAYVQSSGAAVSVYLLRLSQFITKVVPIIGGP